jgi:hypothetical protein
LIGGAFVLGDGISASRSAGAKLDDKRRNAIQARASIRIAENL